MTTHALYLLAISLPQRNKNKVQNVQDPRDVVFLYFKTLCNLNTKMDVFWKSLPLPARQALCSCRPCWRPIYPRLQLGGPARNQLEKLETGWSASQRGETNSLPTAAHWGLSKLPESSRQQAGAFGFSKTSRSAHPTASSILQPNHLYLLYLKHIC